jgi:PAS domain S-box-containing protein
MMQLGLRFRVNLLLTLLVGIFAVGTVVVIVEDAQRSVREEMEAGTRISTQLLETVIASVGRSADFQRRNDEILAFLRHLGRVRAHEISMYDAADNLIYTSPPSVYKTGRDAPDWFNNLVRPSMADLRLNLPSGTIVIRPDASRSVLDAWDDLRNFLWLFLIFLMALNGLVFWLMGLALRPVGTILSSLSKMEKGQLDTRLPDFGLPEFSSISHTFNRMAQALEESHAENQRLALIAKQSSDAIVIHDLEGKISFWNPAAERIFGWPADEVLGKSASVIALPGREAELAENLQFIRCRVALENQETQRVARDGRVVDVALSAAPLVDPASGEVIGETCSMRDITERKRARETELELEQNRRFTQAIQTSLEQERRSLARELHDELGQCVTAIKTIGMAISNRSEESAPDTYKNAQTIVSVAAHIYDVVHGIIRQLRPSALDHLGLADALRDVVQAWSARHPDIKCELDLAEDVSDLGERINIALYRLVQESLTNVARHARATRVEIRVVRDMVAGMGKAIVLTVADNGQGLLEGAEASSVRFGVRGMRERVQSLNGVFELRSGRGAEVIARIPLDANAIANRNEG